MSKFIASVAMLVAMTGVTVMTMINGWGLTPASWTWIIGGAIGQIILLAINLAIAKEESRERATETA